MSIKPKYIKENERLMLKYMDISFKKLREIILWSRSNNFKNKNTKFLKYLICQINNLYKNTINLLYIEKEDYLAKIIPSFLIRNEKYSTNIEDLEHFIMNNIDIKEDNTDKSLLKQIEEINKLGYSIEYYPVNQIDNGYKEDVDNGLMPLITYSVSLIKIENNKSIYSESFDTIYDCLIAGVNYFNKNIRSYL